MKKDEKTMVILLAMASISLAIAYLTFFPATQSQYTDYDEDLDIGNYVQTSGTITQMRTTNTGGHLIMYLKNQQTGNIMIFIPEGAPLEEKFRAGDSVSVCGKIAEYREQREIIVENAACLQKK